MERGAPFRYAAGRDRGSAEFAPETRVIFDVETGQGQRFVGGQMQQDAEIFVAGRGAAQAHVRRLRVVPLVAQDDPAAAVVAPFQNQMDEAIFGLEACDYGFDTF